MFERDEDDDGRLAVWLIGFLLVGAIGGAIVWISGQGPEEARATVTGHVEQVGAAAAQDDADAGEDDDTGAEAGDDAVATTTTVAVQAVAAAYTIDIGSDAGLSGPVILATLTGRVGSQEAADAAQRDALAVFGGADISALEIVADGSVSDAETEISITGSASQTVLDAAAAAYGSGSSVDNELTVSEVAATEEADELVGDLNELFQLDPIQFDSGSTTVQAQSTATLDAAADLLLSVADGTLAIEGHTDDQGADALNLQLSQQRAEAVLAYLVDAGVEAERLSATGFGESEPVADNSTADGRQQNRRIEFRVDEV